MTNYNFESYRQSWETGPHWELKREFLEKYQNDFSEERLLCLAQAYSNMELMSCSYPPALMFQVHELSKSLVGWKEFRHVDKSTAEVTSKGKRKCLGEQNKKYKYIKFCSAKTTETPEETSSVLIPISKEPTQGYSTECTSSAITYQSTSDTQIPVPEEVCSKINEDNLSNRFENFSENEKIFLLKLTKSALSLIERKPHKYPSAALARAAKKLKCKSEILYDVTRDPNTPTNLTLFDCKLFWKNKLISTGKARNKLKAQSKAAKAAFEYWSNPFNEFPIDTKDESVSLKLETGTSASDVYKQEMNVVENCVQSNRSSSYQENISLPHAYKTVSHDIQNKERATSSSVSSIPTPFVLNMKLFNNSLRRQLVILDKSEVLTNSQMTPAFVLSNSAAFGQRKYIANTEPITPSPENPDCIFRTEVILGNELIESGVGKSKLESKSVASFRALEKLKKECYVLKVKDEASEEGFMVGRSRMMDIDVPSNVLSQDNIGCKMLKMMGWTGGGIGKTSGITEPITASEHKFGQGLGYSNNKTSQKNFKLKVDAMLRDFRHSNTTSDLIFSCDFSKDERKDIHRIAQKYGLNSTSYGQGDNRKLFVRRKITVVEVLTALKEAGGSTHKYELVDQSV